MYSSKYKQNKKDCDNVNNNCNQCKHNFFNKNCLVEDETGLKPKEELYGFYTINEELSKKESPFKK